MHWEFDFVNGDPELWQWRCVDSGALLACSSRCFGALWECAEDAIRHGYARDPAQMATSFAQSMSRRAYSVAR